MATWFDFIAVLSLFAANAESGPLNTALISTAMLAPPAFFSTFYVKFVNHYDLKNGLLTGLVARVILTISLLLFVDSFIVVLLLLAFRAAFAGVFAPQIALLASNVADELKPKLSAHISLANNVSKLVIPAFGGVLAVSFGNPFVISLGAMILGFTCVFSFFALKANYVKKEETKLTGSPIEYKHKLELAHAGLYYFLVFSMSNLLPYIFVDIGSGTLLFSIAISCSALGNISAGIILSKNKSNIHRLHFLKSSLLVCLLFFIIYLFITFEFNYLLPIIFALTGYFSAAIQVNITNNTISLPSEKATSYSAGFQRIQSIAMLFGPLFGVLVLEALASEYLFLTASLIGIVYFTLAILMNKRGLVKEDLCDDWVVGNDMMVGNDLAVGNMVVDDIVVKGRDEGAH